MNIRFATDLDAEALLDIYRPFVERTGITQEVKVPSLDHFRDRVRQVLKERPWLVWEENDEILGYAYAGNHRDRKGYQWCVEPSVYIKEGNYRKGIARALYECLFNLLKAQGYVHAYAVITLPNDRSVGFHESFGFKYLTTFKDIGYKLGQWHDVGWWVYQINAPIANPADPIPIFSLSPRFIRDVLAGVTLEE